MESKHSDSESLFSAEMELRFHHLRPFFLSSPFFPFFPFFSTTSSALRLIDGLVDLIEIVLRTSPSTVMREATLLCATAHSSLSPPIA